MDSIKMKFRRYAGYDNEHTCKECKFHEVHRHGNKNCHKCRKMGVSFSAATDIRLKDIACRLFEEADDNCEVTFEEAVESLNNFIGDGAGFHFIL